MHDEAIPSGDTDRGKNGVHIGGKTGGTLHEKMEHHDSQNAVLPGVFFCVRYLSLCGTRCDQEQGAVDALVDTVGLVVDHPNCHSHTSSLTISAPTT